MVDVTSFNDRSWLGGGLQGPPTGGGYFHSYEMHVIERLRREGDRIHYQVTVEDPEVFMEPWTMNAIELKPDPDPKATIVEGSPCNMEYDRTTIVGRNPPLMAMRLRKECSVILMRMRPAVLAAAIGMVTLAGSALSPLAAQSQDLNLEQLVDQQRLPAPPGIHGGVTHRLNRTGNFGDRIGWLGPPRLEHGTAGPAASRSSNSAAASTSGAR